MLSPAITYPEDSRSSKDVIRWSTQTVIAPAVQLRKVRICSLGCPSRLIQPLILSEDSRSSAARAFDLEASQVPGLIISLVTHVTTVCCQVFSNFDPFKNYFLSRIDLHGRSFA